MITFMINTKKFSYNDSYDKIKSTKKEVEKIKSLIGDCPTNVIHSPLSLDSLNQAFAEIEKVDKKITHVVIGCEDYKRMMSWGSRVWCPATKKSDLKKGVLGRIWKADVIVSQNVKENDLYLVSTFEYGAFRKPANTAPVVFKFLFWQN